MKVGETSNLSIKMDSKGPKAGVDKSDTLDILRNIPRGKPKSGRVWRSPKSRHSDFRLEKTLKTSWALKMKQKAEKKSVKDFEKQLKAEKTQKLQDRRKRQEENKKRRLENERKSEIVQPIKNTAKIKRMKKKQLRKIEKR